LHAITHATCQCGHGKYASGKDSPRGKPYSCNARESIARIPDFKANDIKQQLAKGENPDQASKQNGNDPDVLNPQPSERVSSRNLFSFIE